MAQLVKNLLQCRRLKLGPWVGKISRRKEWQPTPVFLPGEFDGQRSLVGNSPRGSQRVRHKWVTNTLTLSLNSETSIKIKNKEWNYESAWRKTSMCLYASLNNHLSFIQGHLKKNFVCLFIFGCAESCCGTQAPHWGSFSVAELGPRVCGLQ